MDPHEKRLLKRALELSEDNNRMLRSLYKAMWWSGVGRVLYWFIVVGTAFGAFFFLQPYLEKVRSVYLNLLGQTGTIDRASSTVNRMLGEGN